MKKVFISFGTIFLLLLMANPSFSQRDSMRAEMKEQLTRLMKERLVEKVGLSESSADRFMQALESNGSQVRALMKERRELMDEIDFDPGAQDVEKKMDRSIEIDIQIAELRKSFKSQLREFMSAQEIAKTMKFRKMFEKELKKEIRKKRGGPDNRGPGGPNNEGPGGPNFDGPDGEDGPPPPSFER